MNSDVKTPPPPHTQTKQDVQTINYIQKNQIFYDENKTKQNFSFCNLKANEKCTLPLLVPGVVISKVHLLCL